MIGSALGQAFLVSSLRFVALPTSPKALTGQDGLASRFQISVL
jgi:hypothetical protein